MYSRRGVRQASCTDKRKGEICMRKIGIYMVLKQIEIRHNHFFFNSILNSGTKKVLLRFWVYSYRPKNRGSPVIDRQRIYINWSYFWVAVLVPKFKIRFHESNASWTRAVWKQNPFRSCLITIFDSYLTSSLPFWEDADIMRRSASEWMNENLKI